MLLTADAYAVLLAWLQVRPASLHPQVFLNQRGQPISANGIQGLLRNYGQQVGCAVTPHRLRHTFARQVTEAGMPITSLGKLLGHAQVSTTQIYTAGADPALGEADQTAMAQVTAHTAVAALPSAAVAERGCRGPTLRAASSSDAPSPPDCTDWASDWPPAIRTACLTYLQHCALRSEARAAGGAVPQPVLGAWPISGVGNWPSALLSQLSEVRLADLRAFQAGGGVGPRHCPPQH